MGNVETEAAMLSSPLAWKMRAIQTKVIYISKAIMKNVGKIWTQTRLKTLFQPQDDENTDKTDKNEIIAFFTMTNYNSDIS